MDSLRNYAYCLFLKCCECIANVPDLPPNYRSLLLFKVLITLHKITVINIKSSVCKTNVIDSCITSFP